MDWQNAFAFHLDWLFARRLAEIMLINIVLAGDNSIVIAMAVHGLAPSIRRKGIVLGSLAAVVLRLAFTFFASWILGRPYIMIGGGALILWIAVKLLTDQGAPEAKGPKPDTVWKAVWIIIVADLTMSLDNVLAVAGASGGSFFLLLLGLGLSIPLVVFASSLLAGLMDRYPIILFAGAVILGKVGADMVFDDPAMRRIWPWPGYSKYLLEVACAAGVLLAAWGLRRRAPRPDPGGEAD